MTNARTLYQRCQGPGAVGFDALIAKADRRIARLQEEYGDDFQILANDMEIAAKDAFADLRSVALRNRLLATILDGATSAATAGYKSVSAIAAHLHDCLEQYGLDNAELPKLVALHLDAMRGAAKWRSSDWTKVLEELRQAAESLGDRLKTGSLRE